jgi:hypothetical protein
MKRKFAVQFGKNALMSIGGKQNIGLSQNMHTTLSKNNILPPILFFTLNFSI